MRHPRYSLVAMLFCGVAFFSPSTSGRSLHAAEKDSSSMLVYIGTYTNGKSEGIYRLSLNLKTGELKQLGVTRGIKNPSFLAIHPNGKNLYSVSEVASVNGKRTGGVTAFAIDPKTGELAELNQQASEGTGPCHLVVDHAGKAVLVANYGGGSVASLPIGKGGRLKKAASAIQHKGSSVNPQRQKGPHAHSINVDGRNKFAVAADLGLDKVLIYKFDSKTGRLTPNDPAFAKVKPGAGPRHFAFHPNGKFAYVINEIHLTVTAFRYDAKAGRLTEIETLSTLPSGTTAGRGLSTAEVQVHPSGKFLYGSNRGHNTVVVYRIDQKTGKLKLVEHESTRGRTPRNFGIDPTGQFLLAANQQSGDIFVFRIDESTGELNYTGQSLKIPNPVCVKFLKR